ncbi:unnamed protein product [Echinostoma caproni]|uniref:Secreted protein n=1 Tax=Echinostoma caproni TaxID=27848 RepID=A0A183AE44_9TREM|nr:unnamed protein product [Echinostoma caproni]
MPDFVGHQARALLLLIVLAFSAPVVPAAVVVLAGGVEEAAAAADGDDDFEEEKTGNKREKVSVQLNFSVETATVGFVNPVGTKWKLTITACVFVLSGYTPQLNSRARTHTQTHTEITSRKTMDIDF